MCNWTRMDIFWTRICKRCRAEPYKAEEDQATGPSYFIQIHVSLKKYRWHKVSAFIFVISLQIHVSYLEASFDETFVENVLFEYILRCVCSVCGCSRIIIIIITYRNGGMVKSDETCILEGSVIGLINPEDEGTTVLRNVDNCFFTSHRNEHPRRLEWSETALW